MNTLKNEFHYFDIEFGMLKIKFMRLHLFFPRRETFFGKISCTQPHTVSLHSVLTWVLPKQVAQQSCVCPVKHILNAHTVWNVFGKTLADVLCKEVSVGVPLTVRHQKQHPHKTNVGCSANKRPTLASENNHRLNSLTKKTPHQQSPVWAQKPSAL